MDPEGALVLASREGGIWRAPRRADGSFQLEAQPFARVSGGRPLGIHHDKDGNLIICTAGKVGLALRFLLTCKSHLQVHKWVQNLMLWHSCTTCEYTLGAIMAAEPAQQSGGLSMHARSLYIVPVHSLNMCEATACWEGWHCGATTLLHVASHASVGSLILLCMLPALQQLAWLRALEFRIRV